MNEFEIKDAQKRIEELRENIISHIAMIEKYPYDPALKEWSEELEVMKAECYSIEQELLNKEV